MEILFSCSSRFKSCCSASSSFALIAALIFEGMMRKTTTQAIINIAKKTNLVTNPPSHQPIAVAKQSTKKETRKRRLTAYSLFWVTEACLKLNAIHTERTMTTKNSDVAHQSQVSKNLILSVKERVMHNMIVSTDMRLAA